MSETGRSDRSRLATWHRVGAAALAAAAHAGCGDRPLDAPSAFPAFERTLEPRISAASHVACVERQRVEDLIPERECAPAPAGGGELRRRILAGRGARALHQQGLLGLIWNRPERALDQAIAALEEALAADPGSPVIRGDLAAAYLARGQRRDDFADLVTALALLDSPPTLATPEAAFNRALALELAHLGRQALAAWEAYFEVDATSAWSSEAREHVAALRRSSLEDFRPELLAAALAGDDRRLERAVSRSRELARDVAEEALGRWAEAADDGCEREAEESLAVARSIAAELAAIGGDDLVADAVKVVDEVLGDGAVALALWSLFAGHRAYSRGLAHDRSYEVEQAERAFAEARDALARAASPQRYWAELQLAVASYRRSRFPEALRALAALERELPDGRYPALRGRIGWLRDMSLISAGNPSASEEAYVGALESYRAAGETGNAGFVHLLRAQVLHRAGIGAMAWSELYRALAAVEQMGSKRRMHGVLDYAAEAIGDGGPCRREEAPDACHAVALRFRDEVVRLAEREGGASETETAPVATDAAHAYLKRARTLDRLDRLVEATADLDRAEVRAAEIESKAIAAQIRSAISIARARIEVRRSPQTAVALLSVAIDHDERGGLLFALDELYLERAHARLRDGDGAAAERDLRRGLELVERNLGGIDDPIVASGYLRRADVLVQELLARIAGAPERAAEGLEYVERSRARVLERLALGSETLPEPLPPDEIRARIPGDIALVELALLDDRLLAWVLRHDSMAFVPVYVGRAALLERVARFRDEVAGEGDAAEASTALHRDLVEPFLPAIGDAGRVVFVPDPALEAVPFAALLSPRTGRCLIEDVAVAVVPSATLYVRARRSGRGRQASDAAGRVLVIGNPAVDREVFPDLPALEGAEAEARAVAALYENSDLLLGAAATRDAFLEHARSHEVIHYAGHALADPARPDRSSLVLAAGAGGLEGGAVFASELARSSLARTRLVVLSACSTAGASGGRRDGRGHGDGAGLALAQSFLAAGVPAVVATLWDVEDGPAAALIVRFHRHRIAGADPAEALRRAQLELLRGPDAALRRTWAWAAFQSIGALGLIAPAKGG